MAGKLDGLPDRALVALTVAQDAEDATPVAQAAVGQHDAARVRGTHAQASARGLQAAGHVATGVLEHDGVGAVQAAVEVLAGEKTRLREGRVQRQRRVGLGHDQAVARLPRGAVDARCHDVVVQGSQDLGAREAPAQVVWVRGVVDRPRHGATANLQRGELELGTGEASLPALPGAAGKRRVLLGSEARARDVVREGVGRRPGLGGHAGDVLAGAQPGEAPLDGGAVVQADELLQHQHGVVG